MVVKGVLVFIFVFNIAGGLAFIIDDPSRTGIVFSVACLCLLGIAWAVDEVAR